MLFIYSIIRKKLRWLIYFARRVTFGNSGKRHEWSYLLTVFIRSRSTTSSCTYRAFYPNKSARVRDGGAIIKTNIPFRAGLLFDVPDGATLRLSLTKNGRDRARSERVRRYMQILDRERGCCQQMHCASSRFFNMERTSP